MTQLGYTKLKRFDWILVWSPVNVIFMIICSFDDHISFHTSVAIRHLHLYNLVLHFGETTFSFLNFEASLFLQPYSFMRMNLFLAISEYHLTIMLEVSQSFIFLTANHNYSLV